MSATGRGFTLLELLVVLAIMTLLVSALPLAAAHVFPRQRLRVAAQDAALALRDLRQTAERTGAITTFELTESGRAWKSSPNESATDFPNGLTAAWMPGGAAAPAVLRFYPDGSTSGGALTLRFAEREEHVLVSPLTGRIHREDPT